MPAATAQEIQRVTQRLAQVRERMAQAAQRVGRSPEEITLVAVSKTRPIQAIQAAYQAGQRDFGENRLEELWPKVEQAQGLGLAEIRWHLIGTIQSRKARMAVGPFVLIHSVDRLKIARRLDRFAQEAGWVAPILLEVNVSGEETKHGFHPASVKAAMDELVRLEGLRIQGLMTMAPFVPDPEQTRPIFRALRQLRDELQAAYPDQEWRHLSMGMTNDFEVAIEEGATIVRIGTAIFGKRAEQA